jgi:glycerol uptake facilitator-like aquaporin
MTGESASPSTPTKASAQAQAPTQASTQPPAPAPPAIVSTAAPLLRRSVAEFIGSGLLAVVVIGSGIAASQLSPNDVGLQLLNNALATAFGLAGIIIIFGPLSGAHINPVITLVDAATGGRPWREALAYVPAQTLGCVAGAVLANLMFGLPAVSLSTTNRLTMPHALSEVVATACLVLVVFSLVRTGRTHLAPAAVGAWIGGAYFFTSSTSFANPAITVGRIFSDSFAGIAPTSAPGFLAAQLIGGLLGLLLIRWLYPAAQAAPHASKHS